MEAHIKHFFGVIEDVLGAVAVVNVPVEDQHFFALVDSMLRCNGHVVEEAEARDGVGVSVVAWWAHYAVTSFVGTRTLLVREDFLYS